MQIGRENEDQFEERKKKGKGFKSICAMQKNVYIFFNSLTFDNARYMQMSFSWKKFKKIQL